jgi:hypothetical protein
MRACVEVSLEDLREDELARPGELAILPEAENIPLGVIEALWTASSGLDVDQTNDLTRRFHGLSLLQSLDLDARTLRLHDNMIRYLRDRIGPEGGCAANGWCAHLEPALGLVGRRAGKAQPAGDRGRGRGGSTLLTLSWITTGGSGAATPLPWFAVTFVVLGAIGNGGTIAYLGYLMEISPDGRRPAYSGYFNALIAPAAFLPLAGAALAEAKSYAWVFAASGIAALLQFLTVRRLRLADEQRSNP